MPFQPNHSMTKCPENCNHRALFKAVGYSDHDLEKPIIGIANSWNEIVPGHFNLRQVAEFVKRGIYAAGGTAVEFGTIACCDGIAQGDGMFAILPTREIIANSVEMMVRAHNLDAIVLLGSCDKIVPGMMMAAARLNIPAILLPGGPMRGGAVMDNRPSDSTSMSEALGMLKAGRMTESEMYEYEESCVPTCGSCSFYGTANTMCCVAEAMGLTLSGGAAIPAYLNDRLRCAEYTGEQIVKLCRDGVTARDILTLDAIENGVIFVNATGGSTNAILHLTALAHELSIPAETVMNLFEKHGRTAPQVVKINPASAYNMEDFYYSGGVPQVLAELKDLLNTGCKTVDEMTVGELIQVHRAPNGIDRNVIKTAAEPFSVGNGLAVLRGNIAPDGCITKPAAIRKDMRTFSGTARVFDSEDDAIRDILGGNIHAGDVLVIRYEGPKGGPGMREMCNAMKYLYGLGLGTSTAIITDGRFSGTNNGCFVGHISPEAAEGGPIAAVRDGDAVTIDIPNRVITLHVSTEEIRERLAHVVKPAPRFTSGYLAMYSKYATSASQGAVLE